MGKGDDPNCQTGAAMFVGTQTGFEIWKSAGGILSYGSNQDELTCQFQDFEVRALGAVELPKQTETVVDACNRVNYRARVVLLHLREGTLIDGAGATFLRPGIYAMTGRSFERVADQGDFRDHRLQAFDLYGPLPALPLRAWHDLTATERLGLQLVSWAQQRDDTTVSIEGRPGARTAARSAARNTDCLADR